MTPPVCVNVPLPLLPTVRKAVANEPPLKMYEPLLPALVPR